MNYILWYFLIYSVAGWVMETIYVSSLEKKYVNRGFLHGFYCPIYGFGMCAIVIILYPHKDNLPALFLGGIILSTVLEYFTGWIMETVFHTRWWDYSHYKFNLNGRICLSRSVEWGFLALLIVEFIHPIIEKSVNIMLYRTGTVMLFAIYILLVADFIYSVVKAAKLSFKIRSLDDIKNEIKLLINKSDLPEKLSALQALISNNELMGKINALIAKHDNIISNIELKETRLLKAFPNIRKSKMINKLKEIKEDLYEKFK